MIKLVIGIGQNCFQQFSQWVIRPKKSLLVHPYLLHIHMFGKLQSLCACTKTKTGKWLHSTKMSYMGRSSLCWAILYSTNFLDPRNQGALNPYQTLASSTDKWQRGLACMLTVIQILEGIQPRNWMTTRPHQCGLSCIQFVAPQEVPALCSGRTVISILSPSIRIISGPVCDLQMSRDSTGSTKGERLNNFLILAAHREEVVSYAAPVIHHIKHFCFIINPSKNGLQSSQQMPHMGLLLDSKAATA